VNGVSYESIRCRHACGIRVSVPSRAELGFLQTTKHIKEACDLSFLTLPRWMGGLRNEGRSMRHDTEFPPPLEETGGSYKNRWGFTSVLSVSVPSRGDWGLLPNRLHKVYSLVMFPSPRGVIGGSNLGHIRYSCIFGRVSVPSRAEWGFLHSGIGILELDDLFLYILEETGGSNSTWNQH